MVDAILVALRNVGPDGFVPIGWLYQSILESRREQRLVEYRGGGRYVISRLGLDEVARQLFRSKSRAWFASVPPAGMKGHDDE